MSAVKELIAAAVERLGDDLESLSRRIHDNPELGYQEVKAAGWLTEFLETRGFKVERGVAGVETAFRATIETGQGPTIAILSPAAIARVMAPRRRRRTPSTLAVETLIPSSWSCRRNAGSGFASTSDEVQSAAMRSKLARIFPQRVICRTSCTSGARMKSA